MCKVKLGYEFCYLYAAVAPATGKFIALLLPDMTKASFSLFMDHFQKETKRLHRHHKVVLIADKAGAHQNSVCAQRGITLQPLPRGCPELNPVERLWRYLRQRHRSNRVYEDVDAVEAAAMSGWRAVCLDEARIRSICRCDYLGSCE